jgi:hypothetical protein
MLPPHARPSITPLYYIPNFLFFNLIFQPPFSLACVGGGRLFSYRNLFFGLRRIHYIIKRMEAMEQWVKAGTVENRFEGDRISQVLHEARIPFLIKSFLDTAYDGLYIPQKGWGIVMVSKKHKEEAERLISEVKKTFVKEEEDETGQLG